MPPTGYSSDRAEMTRMICNRRQVLGTTNFGGDEQRSSHPDLKLPMFLFQFPRFEALVLLYLASPDCVVHIHTVKNSVDMKVGSAMHIFPLNSLRQASPFVLTKQLCPRHNGAIISKTDGLAPL